jgi:hypothetical protein
MRFSGRLTIPDDPSASVPVVLDVEGGEITLTSNDEQLGRYPGSQARVTTLGGSRFQLGLGDEEVVFTPDDAPGFAEYGLSAFGHASVEERPHLVLGGGEPLPPPPPPAPEASPAPTPEDWSSPRTELGEGAAPSPWEATPEPAWEVPAAGEAGAIETEGPAPETPAAPGTPSSAALARMLAEAVLEVRDGSLPPERAHAMAALASAYAQVAALDRAGG